MIHVEVAEDGAFYGESSPSPPAMLPQVGRRHVRRRLNLDESNGIEEEDEEEADLASSPPREEGDGKFGGLMGAETESAKKALKGRSSLQSLGGVRKPLPALPEDPS